MKIAFTTKGTEWNSAMDPRFGRTEFLVIYDSETEELTHFDNRAIEGVAHGAGPQTAQKLHELEAKVLITGNGPGGNAATVLSKTGVDVYIGAGSMTMQEAYEAYKNGSLNKA